MAFGGRLKKERKVASERMKADCTIFVWND